MSNTISDLEGALSTTFTDTERVRNSKDELIIFVLIEDPSVFVTYPAPSEENRDKFIEVVCEKPHSIKRYHDYCPVRKRFVTNKSRLKKILTNKRKRRYETETDHLAKELEYIRLTGTDYEIKLAQDKWVHAVKKIKEEIPFVDDDGTAL